MCVHHTKNYRRGLLRLIEFEARGSVSMDREERLRRRREQARLRRAAETPYPNKEKLLLHAGISRAGSPHDAASICLVYIMRRIIGEPNMVGVYKCSMLMCSCTDSPSASRMGNKFCLSSPCCKLCLSFSSFNRLCLTFIDNTPESFFNLNLPCVLFNSTTAIVLDCHS